MGTNRGTNGLAVTYGCPVEVTIEVIGGKWKCVILWWLRNDAKSFGELKQLIPKVTSKVLTQQLRELERDGLIHREAYRESPPRVEYSLTPQGGTLRPIMDLMCEWGKANLPGFKSGILRLEGLRVLLVVEEADVRKPLCMELEKRAIQVSAVASASEALAELNQLQPHVLIVDTGMSDGEGYALIHQIKVQGREQRLDIPMVNQFMLKAIALIDPTNPSDRKHSLREGFQVRLPKPVDAAELVATLVSLTSC